MFAKRSLRVVFSAATLALFLSSQTVFAAPGFSILKQGTSGSVVTELQQGLNKLGFLSVSPTGYFGTSTLSAVKTFQKKYGLDMDGVAGFFTFSQMDRLLDKTSEKSTDAQIIIDPGHGGDDPGCRSGNVVEKEINLDISRKLQKVLEDKNYTTSLTRTTDTTLFGRGASLEEKDLSGRTKIINRSTAKLVVSIHVNSLMESPGTSGSIVFYNPALPQSRTLALAIQKELNTLTVNSQSRYPWKPQTANFYVLKYSNIPGVLVETAFITNKQERSALTQQSFRQDIAEAVAAGVENSGLLK